MKVVVVGTWHLGSVVGTCLAAAGNEVHLWDQSEKVAAKWREGRPPLHEPGLDDLVKTHWRKKLFWAQDLASVVPTAQWIVVAYDTPINDQDEVLLEVVEEGVAKILKSGFSDQANFFFTSQLPVGTSGRFRKDILIANPKWRGHVFYQPENLRLGEAIKSFQNPDRMVLGVDSMNEKEILAKTFQDLLGNTTTPLNVMSLESSEMVKHALNSFLGTCVVFANEISEICEKAGADSWDVMASLKQDSRVGPKAFLRPGLGFSGGTLARDVKTLSKLTGKSAKENFFSQLYDLNNHRNDWILARLKESIALAGEKIILLGVTYKPFTSTVRRSPALDIGNLLRGQGATCVALDPMADLDELTQEERNNLPFHLENNPMEAFKDASAAIVVTEWPQFLEWNWKELKVLMKNPIIIDSKNHLASKNLGADYRWVVPGKPLGQSTDKAKIL